MSDPETAVQTLRQTLGQLIPTLLESLSDLHQQHAAQLLGPDEVLAVLRPRIVSADARTAFGISKNPAALTGESDLRIRNLCSEVSNNELRRMVFAYSSTESIAEELSDAALVSVYDRLDTVLAFSLEDLIDPMLPLTLMEELIEVSAIPACSQLFTFIESRVKQLTIDLLPTKGKGLVLLRTCNELLRRLSKPSHTHTVFSGRILSLLAAVFPLGERSGVNLRGEFNVDNVVDIEGPEAEGDSSETPRDLGNDDAKDAVFKVDYHFYQLFWNVQRFFSNPVLLMAKVDPISRPPTRHVSPSAEGFIDLTEDDASSDRPFGPMTEFRDSTEKIIALFAAVAKREKELAGAATADGLNGTSLHSTSGAQKQSSKLYPAGQSIVTRAETDAHRNKRTKLSDSKGDIDVDMDQSEEMITNVEQDRLFFPNYLTGRKLLEYEIRDVAFRKQIIVQYLVLFQYLLSFSPAAKENWKDWKNKTLQLDFSLEEADERWIRQTWRELQTLVRDIQPDGRRFLESVLEVLKRETNWIKWKTESCPSIGKPPLTAEQIAVFASAKAMLTQETPEYPHKLGTAALSELWLDGLPPPVPGSRKVEDEMGNEVSIATDGLEELEFLPPVPSLQHYHKSTLREEMKMQMRKKQLGLDPKMTRTQLSEEDRQKLEKDDKVQSIVESTQTIAWRALRVARQNNLHLFGKSDRPDNFDALYKSMEAERNAATKAKRKAEPSTESEIAKAAVDTPNMTPGNGTPLRPEVSEVTASPEAITTNGEQDTTATAEDIEEVKDIEMADAPSA